MKIKRCYICNDIIDQEELQSIHNHRLCITCGEFNFNKRLELSDLTDRIALVTGGRIKIGYETSLKLLRSGCKVVITTRFPGDAIKNYTLESDFEEWKDRLSIVKIDFRNLNMVESFIKSLYSTLPHLDILINNAAQTIRRPVEYFRYLEKGEVRIKDRDNLISPISNKFNFFEYQKKIDSKYPEDVRLLDFKLGESNDMFPIGELDCEGLQLDLREINSWVTKLEDISTLEMLEVQVINSTVPFLFCSKLKRLMMQSPFEEKFIINVSAMEGQFSKPYKSIYHPHTNMAKAALNMLVRTSSRDYAKSGIYMNVVDTGWVTDEEPHIYRMRRTEDTNAPIDSLDGASRVCDPIFKAINIGELSHGKFFKDYKITTW